MKCIDGSYESTFFTEIPDMCAPVQNPMVPHENLQSLRLTVLDPKDKGKQFKIDIIIGVDIIIRCGS